MATTNLLDSFSSAYDDDFIYALDNRLILNWYPERVIALSQGASILELGVGHGFSTHRFAKAFSRHVVLDGSPEIIAKFQQKFPDCSADIVEGYFETFETEERFDVIMMGFVLEHVDDPGLILSYYRKFLKPGGSLFITVPNAEALNKRYGYEAGLLNNLFELGKGDIAQGHKQLFSVETLTKLVQAHGYKPKTVEGLFLKPITTTQIKTLDLSEDILQAMLKVGVHYPELSVGILMELQDSQSQ